jgi:hypothetical protein
MAKVAIVVLADAETHGDLGRVVNALETARECKAANDDVQIIFDGAGTRWVPILSDPEHRRHALFADVQDKIAGACSYCSTAFGAKEGIQQCGIRLLDDFDGHPSIRSLIADGYHVLTF